MLSGSTRTTARRAALVTFAVAALTAAALVANAPAGSTAAPAVKTVLTEWKVKPSVATVRPGPVTFVVRNAGGIPHEFVILRTNRQPRALPMKGSQAVETGEIGEIEELKPGQTKRLTVRLGPGKYVLLCNLPGHYQAGQSAAFRVS